METIAIIGLGYVGLPLAVALGAHHPTIGFDRNERKIENYRNGIDPTGEVSAAHLRAATRLEYTTDPADIKRADIVIIAVPTPIDAARRPDFTPLKQASRKVGLNLKQGAVVVYESTVYPGATEEVCVPILEEWSRMKWKRDFHVGYSPERINPGDKTHTLETIVKLVAADDAESLERVARVYESVVKAGVHRMSSIQAAEAAKVIENTQRDLNIALMNELAIIFNRMGLDTLDVLEGAGTKWNFLPFRPGLVGGHCIGVDPYYLTYKAEMLGYQPQVILAGRRINDGMGKFIAEQTVKNLIARDFNIKGSRVTVLGLTFKENCPDIRNSRVPDVIAELRSYGIEVSVHDPLADAGEAIHEYAVELLSWEDLPKADALVLAVSHREFIERDVAAYVEKVVTGGCVIDVKSVFDRQAFEAAGLAVWRL
jgi:UDP-N-acetyl-D-galactosamine dehydrogenase